MFKKNNPKLGPSQIEIHLFVNSLFSKEKLVRSRSHLFNLFHFPKQYDIICESPF